VMTAVLDAEPWCGMCKRWRAAIPSQIYCAETHYGQPVSRICTRCKAVLRISRLHGIELPYAPLTSWREFWFPAVRALARGTVRNQPQIAQNGQTPPRGIGSTGRARPARLRGTA
jgi:hypothetical protein